MFDNDSILFLLAARETLCLIAESSDISKDNKNSLTDFIINEASDYQVMSLLLDGKLPDTDVNEAEEEKLFKRLKVIVAANKKLVCEMFGFDVYDDVLKKVNPLYPKLSTTKPVLNFHLGTGGLNALLEAPFLGELTLQQRLARSRAARERIKQQVAKMSPAERAKELARLKQAGVKVPKAAKKVAAKVVKKDPLAALPKAYKDPAKKVVKTVSKAKTHFDKPIADIKRKVAAKKPAVKDLTKKGVEVGAKAKTAAMGVMQQIKNKATSGLKAVSAFATTPAGQAVGGAALAALALYASYKVYKRFLSKAAKACRGMGGAEKTACMRKFQISGYNAQIKDLQAASGACAKAKNPAKCKTAIAKKIYKVKKKMAKAT